MTPRGPKKAFFLFDERTNAVELCDIVTNKIPLRTLPASPIRWRNLIPGSKLVNLRVFPCKLSVRPLLRGRTVSEIVLAIIGRRTRYRWRSLPQAQILLSMSWWRCPVVLPGLQRRRPPARVLAWSRSSGSVARLSGMMLWWGRGSRGRRPGSAYRCCAGGGYALALDSVVLAVAQSSCYLRSRRGTSLARIPLPEPFT